MLFISRDENRDIQQEFNSRSISLASKIVGMTTFVATLFMETAGVEPVSPRNVFITINIRLSGTLKKHSTTILTTVIIIQPGCLTNSFTLESLQLYHL